MIVLDLEAYLSTQRAELIQEQLGFDGFGSQSTVQSCQGVKQYTEEKVTVQFTI